MSSRLRQYQMVLDARSCVRPLASVLSVVVRRRLDGQVLYSLKNEVEKVVVVHEPQRRGVIFEKPTRLSIQIDDNTSLLAVVRGTGNVVAANLEIKDKGTTYEYISEQGGFYEDQDLEMLIESLD